MHYSGCQREIQNEPKHRYSWDHNHRRSSLVNSSLEQASLQSDSPNAHAELPQIQKCAKKRGVSLQAAPPWNAGIMRPEVSGYGGT